MTGVADKKRTLKPTTKPKADPMNEQTVRWYAELEAVLSPFWSVRQGQG